MSDAELRTDDGLLEALGAAFARGVTEVPEHLTKFAIDAFRWRLIDGELAHLVDDASASASVRGGEARHHTFVAHSATVSVQVTGDRVVGAVEPAGEFTVTATTTEGPEHTTPTDALGRFQMEVATPFRLVVRSPALMVTTEWMTG